jgi:hypothetical protein
VQTRRAGLVASPTAAGLAKGEAHELILAATAHPGRPRLRFGRAEPPARVRRHVHDPVRSLTSPRPSPSRGLGIRERGQFVPSASRSRRTTSRESTHDDLGDEHQDLLGPPCTGRNTLGLFDVKGATVQPSASSPESSTRRRGAAPSRPTPTSSISTSWTEATAFAAWHEPDLFTTEIRAAFRSLR